MGWLRRIFLTIALATALWTIACHRGDAPPAAEAPAEPAAAEPAWFDEVAAESGLDFTHFNGMSGEFYFCEIIGSGGALFDYDRDGDLDVYLVQGAMIGEGKAPADALFPPPADAMLRDRLFRNDLETGADGAARPRFVDVTAESGIDARDYGLGAAVGDIDNDGWPDLYVTNLGPNRLYRNRGDGTFEEVGAAAGVALPEMGVSASFYDYDRDGWLDLFVGNYVDYAVARNERCYMGGAVDYCHPTVFPAVPDRLLRNRGDGTFEDVSAQVGLDKAYGRALGVAVADLNGDGRLDVYVANDKTANQFWVDNGDGTYAERAMYAGNALNEMGMAEASMGVDAGDVDGDGDEDLFVTHYRNETNTYYQNDGSGTFVDHTVLSGLGPASLPYTGFGTGWLDIDNDGWLDVIAANGAVSRTPEMSAAADPFPYAEPNQLFRNTGDGRFLDVSARGGPVFQRAEVSRAAMLGDIDNDGDMDALITNNSGPARLFLNRVGTANNWLGVSLWLPERKREPVGARVALVREDGSTRWRRARADASYACANDPRVIFGLGQDQRYQAIRVVWPDGLVEEWRELPINAWHRLERGAGTPLAEGGP